MEGKFIYCVGYCGVPIYLIYEPKIHIMNMGNYLIYELLKVHITRYIRYKKFI
jgi:hypothetical protein